MMGTEAQQVGLVLGVREVQEGLGPELVQVAQPVLGEKLAQVAQPVLEGQVVEPVVWVEQAIRSLSATAAADSFL
jgi:hypothetical protein